MSSIQAIIFDLDGLLVDTEPLFFKAMRDVLRAYRVRLREDEYIRMDLQNGKSILEHFRSASRIPRNGDVEEAIYKLYFEFLKTDLREMPGAVMAVRCLSADYLLALASSSRMVFIKYILERLAIEHLFRSIVSRESTSNLKPDPECLLTVLAELRLPASGCVLIEDSVRGLKAAKEIQMPCIVIPNKLTRNADFAGAALVLRSLRDLTSDVIRTVSR